MYKARPNCGAQSSPFIRGRHSNRVGGCAVGTRGVKLGVPIGNIVRLLNVSVWRKWLIRK